MTWHYIAQRIHDDGTVRQRAQQPNRNVSNADIEDQLNAIASNLQSLSLNLCSNTSTIDTTADTAQATSSVANEDNTTHPQTTPAIRPVNATVLQFKEIADEQKVMKAMLSAICSQLNITVAPNQAPHVQSPMFNTGTNSETLQVFLVPSPNQSNKRQAENDVRVLPTKQARIEHHCTYSAACSSNTFNCARGSGHGSGWPNEKTRNEHSRKVAENVTKYLSHQLLLKCQSLTPFLVVNVAVAAPARAYETCKQSDGWLFLPINADGNPQSVCFYQANNASTRRRLVQANLLTQDNQLNHATKPIPCGLTQAQCYCQAAGGKWHTHP